MESSREVQRGPVGKRVAANVRRLRRAREWKQQDLSDALAEVGRPIVTSGISKIEKGERRLDVDDLVALAFALEVTPYELVLANPETGVLDLAEEVPLTERRSMVGGDARQWFRGAIGGHVLAYDEATGRPTQEEILAAIQNVIDERFAEWKGKRDER